MKYLPTILKAGIIGFFISFLYSGFVFSGFLNSGYLLILSLLILAISGFFIESIKPHIFTISLLVAVSLGLFYPQYFIKLGSFKFSTLIVPLIQLIMFTMGTEMSLKDFEGVLKMPKAVIIGLISHFTIMPLVGVTLANIFGFPSEIAAGIILIGSVPSGVTSNVLAFLAKANVPLSVTIASISTLMAPIMTPLLMKLLAGKYVNIDFIEMMLHVVKIIIVPIILGLLINKLMKSKLAYLKKIMPIISMIGVFMMLIVIVSSGRDALLKIGPYLFLASMIHHSIGYLLGYWSGRFAGLDEQACRTISLEVGMQNGGLASGIALQMGKIATVGLASAISVPWMTISGSLLANWWRSKPIENFEKKELIS
jgi:BASS family bile acid:Na+ symporter